MAHYEYTKTFSFYATAEVPYRYTCGKCGREVSGRAELAVGAAALAVLCAVVYVRQVRGGNSDFTFLGCALFLLFFGAMFIVRAAWDIKGLKTARGQSEQKPEVFFDQMTSPWLDRLKD